MAWQNQEKRRGTGEPTFPLGQKQNQTTPQKVCQTQPPPCTCRAAADQTHVQQPAEVVTSQYLQPNPHLWLQARDKMDEKRSDAASLFPDITRRNALPNSSPKSYPIVPSWRVSQHLLATRSKQLGSAAAFQTPSFALGFVPSAFCPPGYQSSRDMPLSRDLQRMSSRKRHYHTHGTCPFNLYTPYIPT